MNGFKGRFTSIKDISDRRRLPRLGKIRLGIKMVSQKTGKEFPRETEYFVCPPEVQKHFGEKPKELPIMFPIEDREIVFPQAYKFYGKSKGLKCIGNGEEALRTNEKGEFEEIACPCDFLEKKKCQRRGHLMVVIPKVSLGGVYQIDVGSYHSIVDINSGIEYVKEQVKRFSWVPLILKRLPKETFEGDARNIHHTLHVHLPEDMSIAMINMLREDTERILEGPRYALPVPIDENPKFDNGATTEYTDEEETQPEPGEGKKPELTQSGPKGFNLLKKKMVGKIISINSDQKANAILPKDLTGDQANQLIGILDDIQEPTTIDAWLEHMREIGAIQ